MRKRETVPPEWTSQVVVCLNRSSSAELPLVIIHGVDGEVHRFRALLPHISDRDVFAVRAQALVRPAIVLTHVEQLAAFYAEKIDAACGGRPYALLGFSFGGYIAYEIGRQHLLRQAGGDSRTSDTLGGPEYVIMLDTRSMGRNGGLVSIKAQASQRVSAETTGGAASLLSPALRAHVRRICSAEGLRYVAERVHARSLRYCYQLCELLGVQIPGFLQTAYNLNWFAATRYTPQPMARPITLLKSDETAQLWKGDIDRWAQLTSGQAIEMIVPGQHETLFFEPHVGDLAGALKTILHSAAVMS